MSASVQKVSGEMLNTSICLLYYIYFMKGTNKIQKNKKIEKYTERKENIKAILWEIVFLW